jgi:nucleoid DNA-binding protein
MTKPTTLRLTNGGNPAATTLGATQALDNSPANLTQLAEMLGQRHRLPKQVTQRMLADAFELIEIGTLAHGRFVVRGFGMWRLSLAAPRTGRNPKQGTPVALAARAQMKFAHGKDRRESFSEVGLRLAKARHSKAMPATGDEDSD